MVIEIYGSHTAEWLVEQTDIEPPWLNSRKRLPADAKASPEISINTMKRYYGKIFDTSSIKINGASFSTERIEGFTAEELRQRYASILCS